MLSLQRKFAVALLAITPIRLLCASAVGDEMLNDSKSFDQVPAELMPHVRIARDKLSELGVKVPDDAQAAVYRLAAHDFETVGFSFDFDHEMSSFYVNLRLADLSVLRVWTESFKVERRDSDKLFGIPQIEVLFPSNAGRR